MADVNDARSKRPATYEDLRRAPPGQVAELIDGNLHLSPRPALRHAQAASIAGADLATLFSRKPGGPLGPGGWWILYEPELHLSRDVVVPDVAGWRRERLPSLPEEAAFFEVVPDWICEVISPSSVGRDRVAKMRIYARAGVQHVWLVDPVARSVEVFRLKNEGWFRTQAVTGSAPARLEPFDAVELDLARWWGETPDPDIDAGP